MSKNKGAFLESMDEIFNESLPEDGFSLTKMFDKNSLPVKTVNLLLLTACTAGAFNVQAKELVQSDLYNSNITAEKTLATDMLKDAYADPTIITADNLESIADDLNTGVYTMEGSDRLVVLSFNGEDSDHSEVANNWIDSFYVGDRLESYAIVDYDYSDISYVNIDANNKENQEYKNNQNWLDDVVWDDEVENLNTNETSLIDDGFVTETTFDEEVPNSDIEQEINLNEITPDSEMTLLQENFDLRVLAHELSHTNKKQRDYIDDFPEDGLDLEKILQAESTSDLFSILAVSKIKKYNQEETLGMISDLSDDRNDYLVNHNDFVHSTMLSLSTLSNALENNDGLLDDLKSLSLEEIDSVVFKMSKNTLDTVDYNVTREKLTKDELDAIEFEDQLEKTIELRKNFKEVMNSELSGSEFDNVERDLLNDVAIAKINMKQSNLKDSLEDEIKETMSLDEDNNKVSRSNKNRLTN